MPEIITCPDCGRKLRVPDELIGKKVKCPDCKVKFTGSITSAPNSAKSKPVAGPSKLTDDEDERPPLSKKSSRSNRDEEEDDEERPSKRQRRSQGVDDEDDAYGRSSGKTPEEKLAGWKMTLTGLNLLVYATYVFLGALALALLGCVAMAAISSAMDVTTALPSIASIGIIGILIYVMIGLAYLAYLGLQITGNGLCMAVPDKPGTGRKGLAIATFSCACGTVLLYLMSCGLTSLSPRLAGLGIVVGFVPLALSIGYFVCYFLFLRNIALAMKEPGLAGQLVYYMIAVPCIMVLVVVMYVVMFVALGVAAFGAASSNTGQGAMASMGAFGIFGMVCSIVFFCIYVGMIVWYIMLIHKVRNAVKNYLD